MRRATSLAAVCAAASVCLAVAGCTATRTVSLDEHLTCGDYGNLGPTDQSQWLTQYGNGRTTDAVQKLCDADKPTTLVKSVLTAANAAGPDTGYGDIDSPGVHVTAIPSGPATSDLIDFTTTDGYQGTVHLQWQAAKHVNGSDVPMTCSQRTFDYFTNPNAVITAVEVTGRVEYRTTNGITWPTDDGVTLGFGAPHTDADFTAMCGSLDGAFLQPTPRDPYFDVMWIDLAIKTPNNPTGATGFDATALRFGIDNTGGYLASCGDRASGLTHEASTWSGGSATLCPASAYSGG